MPLPDSRDVTFVDASVDSAGSIIPAAVLNNMQDAIVESLKTLLEFGTEIWAQYLEESLSDTTGLPLDCIVVDKSTDLSEWQDYEVVEDAVVLSPIG
jgi:hypothetical protein